MRLPARRATAASTALAGALAVLAGLAGPAGAAACTGPGPSTVRADINGDGRADAVVTEYGRGQLAGGVHVLYGTSKGLTADASGTAPNDQFLTQDTKGVPGS